MAVKIVGVKPTQLPDDPIKAHETMESFAWVNEQDQASGSSSRETMYDWIVNKKGKAYVLGDNGKISPVFGMITPSGTRIIRTAENGNWTDLLIELEKNTKPPDAS